MSMYIMLKGRPCKVCKVSFAKPGKHGHVKCNIEGKDILNDKKYQHMCPGHESIPLARVVKSKITVSDLEFESGGEENLQTCTAVACLDEDGEEVHFNFNANKP